MMNDLRPYHRRLFLPAVLTATLLFLALGGPARAGCLTTASSSCGSILQISIVKLLNLPAYGVTVGVKSPHSIGCYEQLCTNGTTNTSFDELYWIGGTNISAVYAYYSYGCPSQYWEVGQAYTGGYTRFDIKVKFEENGGTRKKKFCSIFLPPIDDLSAQSYVTDASDPGDPE
jgi:hypothetical protein